MRFCFLDGSIEAENTTFILMHNSSSPFLPRKWKGIFKICMYHIGNKITIPGYTYYLINDNLYNFH